MRKKNIYTHEIELKKLTIVNAPKKNFTKELEKIQYRGYEVETIKDGRKIVITKPGGKFTYGQIRKEDFMVFVYNPSNNSLWLISHKDIYNDLCEKSKKDALETLKIISALEKVYNGDEPNIILKSNKLFNPIGELPEVILKAYKWIWGQEDVNYPNHKGRAMSFEGIIKLRGKIENGEKI